MLSAAGPHRATGTRELTGPSWHRVCNTPVQPSRGLRQAAVNRNGTLSATAPDRMARFVVRRDQQALVGDPRWLVAVGFGC
jgi:hypothetical protein